MNNLKLIMIRIDNGIFFCHTCNHVVCWWWYFWGLLNHSRWKIKKSWNHTKRWKTWKWDGNSYMKLICKLLQVKSGRIEHRQVNNHRIYLQMDVANLVYFITKSLSTVSENARYICVRTTCCLWYWTVQKFFQREPSSVNNLHSMQWIKWI